MTMAKQHISSASLTGPYWADINFSPLDAIPDVCPSCSACLLDVVRAQMLLAEGPYIDPLWLMPTLSLRSHCQLDRKAGPQCDAGVVPFVSRPHIGTGLLWYRDGACMLGISMLCADASLACRAWRSLSRCSGACRTL